MQLNHFSADVKSEKPGALLGMQRIPKPLDPFFLLRATIEELKRIQEACGDEVKETNSP